MNKRDLRTFEVSLETSLGAGSIYSFSIGYAPDGDVTSVNDSVNGQWTYTYDGFNRLNGSSCSSHCPNGQNSEAYSHAYDRYGNMWHGDGGLSISYSGGNNRIDGYSYDAAGNLLSDGTHSYAYDAENRIVSVDGGATTYAYDAGGQKVAKVNSSGDYTNVLDLSGRTVAMIGYNGVVWRDEIYSGARHLATYANGTTYFDHADWLGTERVRSSVSGASCETIASLPFGDGQVTSGSCGDPSPNHFTGKERDAESGNDYFGARYYNSAMGRWLSPDWSVKEEPVPYAKLEDPQTLNLYDYVRNNPLSNVDADGHACSGVLGNTGSGFCNRATEYGKIDANPTIQSQTRFFAAANAVSQSLADVAAWSPAVRAGGISARTATFLESVGQKLQVLNETEAHMIAGGALKGPGLDQQMVHNEQTAVQGQLDALKQSNPDAYNQTISQINVALNPGALGKEAASLFSTDKAFQGVLDEVRKDLGRNIDFSKQSDREAIGNALIQHIRQTGGCDVNGKRQSGC